MAMTGDDGGPTAGLEHLDDDARGALEIAAAYGDGIDADVLRLLWHRPPAEVDELVDRLAVAGVLTRDLRWVDEEVRKALLREIPPGRLATLQVRTDQLRERRRR